MPNEVKANHGDAHERSSGEQSFIAWFLAFLFFPHGPFIYMAMLGAMKRSTLLAMLVVSLIWHLGGYFVLFQTNDRPWQPWILIVMWTGLYVLGIIQYYIGKWANLWSSIGRILWLTAGWLLGLMLLAMLVALITLFHIGPIG